MFKPFIDQIQSILSQIYKLFSIQRSLFF